MNGYGSSTVLGKLDKKSQASEDEEEVNPSNLSVTQENIPDLRID